MRTLIREYDGRLSPNTRLFPAVCASCGAVRMLAVAENQPLVDVRTVAAKAR